MANKSKKKASTTTPAAQTTKASARDTGSGTEALTKVGRPVRRLRNPNGQLAGDETAVKLHSGNGGKKGKGSVGVKGQSALAGKSKKKKQMDEMDWNDEEQDASLVDIASTVVKSGRAKDPEDDEDDFSDIVDVSENGGTEEGDDDEDSAGEDDSEVVTPPPQYKPPPRIDIHLDVYDGRASRTLVINTSYSFAMLLNEAASLMKVDYQTVTLGYEAPWVRKTGTKPQPKYLENSKDLEKFMADFWLYMDEQKVKKKGKGSPVQYSILLKNMNLADQSTGKKVAVTKQPVKENIVTKSDNAATKIQMELEEFGARIDRYHFCKEHNRPCVKKNGKCLGPITHEHISEWAKLLLAKVEGVTVETPPEQLKLLDYKKPHRNIPSTGGHTSHVNPNQGAKDHDSDSAPSDRSVRGSKSRRSNKRRHSDTDTPAPKARKVVDYPETRVWLESCNKHMSRGRDKEIDYVKFADELVRRKFLRLDDIADLEVSELMDIFNKDGQRMMELGEAKRIYRFSRADAKMLSGDDRYT
ncbi:hypothetical protein DFH11DRAFT_1545127 [Phellopilus nigrolimitatus]|nr:hypothetical protein DFH11DRAFT_1545127 [Phellopilus nigrolimitatus]